jgi:hypothetical protein
MSDRAGNIWQQFHSFCDQSRVSILVRDNVALLVTYGHVVILAYFSVLHEVRVSNGVFHYLHSHFGRREVIRDRCRSPTFTSRIYAP